MSAEAKLAELGLELPPAPRPQGLYKPMVVTGNIAYVSGHGPMLPDGSFVTGLVGSKLDQQAAYEAARLTGLAILATLRAELGSLDRVHRVLKVLGMVYCTPDFDQQPAVINGCSQLFADVFGLEAGIGARSAVGVAALPMGIAVEIEAVFELCRQPPD
ncbi:MAG: RidA family protein [Planctomycetota bacterium]